MKGFRLDWNMLYSNREANENGVMVAASSFSIDNGN